MFHDRVSPKSLRTTKRLTPSCQHCSTKCSMSWALCSFTTALTFTGGLTGTGDTKGPLYISIVAQVLLPIGLLEVLSRTTTLVPNHIWMAIVIGHFTRASLTVWRFRRGKWRDIRIDMVAKRA